MIEILDHSWRAFLWTDERAFSGLAVTLWLLVISIGIGFFVSIPLAVARVSTKRYICGPVWLFTYIFRGTPLYVQLLLIYSGIYSLDSIRGVDVLNAFFRSGYNCTILALILNTCAYTTEMFAGAIKATDFREIEAARAYGMTDFTLYRRIIIPGALRRALPAYSNEVILMLHATSLAFTATVPDILKVARDVNAATYQSFQAFGIAGLLYLVVTFALVALFRRAERKWLVHLRPQNT